MQKKTLVQSRTACLLAMAASAAAVCAGSLPASAAVTTTLSTAPAGTALALPAAPALPAVPDTPNIPTVPQTPSIPNIPSTPDTPNIPSVPQTPDVPNIPSTPDTPNIPSVPQTPDVPNIPSIPDAPDVPQTPNVPSVPQTPDVPSVPQTPDVPSVPGAPSGSLPACAQGEPTAAVSLLSPAQAAASAAFLVGEAAPPTDPDDVGVPDLVAARIELIDCVGQDVTATTSVAPSIDIQSADGAYLQSGGGSQGSSSAEPSLNSQVKRPALNRGDYGKRFRDDGSNVGATWFVYATTERDRRGRPLILWQNADITAGDDTNYTKAESFIHQEGGPGSLYDDASPLGQEQVEASRGYDVNLKVTVEKKDAASVEAGVAKTIAVSHSVFGGGNYRDSDGHVYAHAGGYRSIAKGYRNQNRAWSEAAAWTFPPGASQTFSIAINWSYKNR